MAPNVVDLEELVISWAWNTFVRTRSKDYGKLRFEDLKFDVVWDRVRFVAGRPVYTGEKKLNKPHSQVVFKSVYENKTGNVQDHSFQTNRTTVSSCNTTVCKGYTKGINLELKLGLPEEIMSATAGFGREVTMESSDDFTHEETISWSINSNIKVPPQHKTIAELVVKEQEYTASFKMCARIRGHLVVMLTNLRDNNSFVQSIEADFADIMREHAETHSKHFTIEGHVVNWEVLGKCQFRYGVEQHVQLTDQPLVETDLSATD